MIFRFLLLLLAVLGNGLRVLAAKTPLAPLVEWSRVEFSYGGSRNLSDYLSQKKVLKKLQRERFSRAQFRPGAPGKIRVRIDGEGAPDDGFVYVDVTIEALWGNQLVVATGLDSRTWNAQNERRELNQAQQQLNSYLPTATSHPRGQKRKHTIIDKADGKTEVINEADEEEQEDPQKSKLEQELSSAQSRYDRALRGGKIGGAFWDALESARKNAEANLQGQIASLSNGGARVEPVFPVAPKKSATPLLENRPSLSNLIKAAGESAASVESGPLPNLTRSAGKRRKVPAIGIAAALQSGADFVP